jgi:uncharacterized protein YggL (DUF469 family)
MKLAVQRILEMDFASELGKSIRLRVYDVKADATGEQVSTLMDSIITKNIFSSSGGALTSKLSARIVNKETSDLTLI